VTETVSVGDGRWTVDLDVFEGPFDLLITLILNEEIDLLEVHLAEVVLAYLERLEQRGELDLEAATEFLVLIAALLELKSRLMLPGEEVEGLDIEPQEAVEELLARMLEYKRYRAAAEALRELFAAESGYSYRSAPLPPELRRVTLEAARPSYEPALLSRSIDALLRTPPQVDTSHLHRITVSFERRLQHVRELLASRRRFSFEEAVAGEDRMTQAVTLFALLELYKSGELTWKQKETFGEIEIEAVQQT
jgi:segregation and condensation protein A